VATKRPGSLTYSIRLWCKRRDLARYDVDRAAGGVGIGKLTGVEQLFEGRHFDREGIILCVRWYVRFKLSLRDLVESRTRPVAGSYDHCALGVAIRAGVREALEAVRPGGRPVMEGGRDIGQNSRRMALSLSCGGSGGADG
jgi:hypothetical protein